MPHICDLFVDSLSLSRIATLSSSQSNRERKRLQILGATVMLKSATMNLKSAIIHLKATEQHFHMFVFYVIYIYIHTMALLGVKG